jgi:hypothetical protein
MDLWLDGLHVKPSIQRQIDAGMRPWFEFWEAVRYAWEQVKIEWAAHKEYMRTGGLA